MRSSPLYNLSTTAIIQQYPSKTPAATAAKSLQSCPTLCDPIDGSPSGSTFPVILQARTLERVATCFSSAWKWKVKVKSPSRVWLLATPWTITHQAPPSTGLSRQDHWSGMPLGFSCFSSLMEVVPGRSSRSFPFSLTPDGLLQLLAFPIICCPLCPNSSKVHGGEEENITVFSPLNSLSHTLERKKRETRNKAETCPPWVWGSSKYHPEQ